jgi:hypothetical protein
MNESDASQFSLNQPDHILMHRKPNNPPFFHYQNNRLDPIEPPVSPENIDISLISPVQSYDNLENQKDQHYEGVSLLA